ncbi:MAG: phage tail sheath family protein [Bacteroidetes bacterium]|nr:phage tail sheath family protein [Bacteroidota bacterium]
MVTRLTADAATDDLDLRLASMRGIQVGTAVRLRMTKDNVVTQMSAAVNVASYDASTNTITLASKLTEDYEARYTAVFTDVDDLDSDGGPTVALADPFDPRTASFSIAASSEGSWGLAITIQTASRSAARSQYVATLGTPADGDNDIQVQSASGFYAKAWVEIDNGKDKFYRQVISVTGNVLKIDGTDVSGVTKMFTAQGSATVVTISACEFDLTATYGSVVEQFAGLTLENIAGKYYVDRINNSSTLITVGTPSAGTHPFRFPTSDTVPTAGMRSSGESLRLLLTQNGSDGTAAPTDTTIVGTDNGPGTRTGIRALEDIDVVSIIAAPGLVSTTVQGALIEQCERLKDRFAVLDPENAQQTLDQIVTQRLNFDTKYAAIYYPRLTVLDPLTNVEIYVPPSGHVVGIYARTDIERGVHKAPANEVVRGITGLALTINKGEQDILNPLPNNVNVIRDFRSDGRGFRVWGARCITSDTDWKYIPVRRLFIMIEESIDQGTQWVVFEPNDEPLWARVRRSVSNFLTNVWRDGALQGKKPEEAFFVRCDRSTMSQDDIDNGRLIMVIGIAPVKPAEFVIFRIGQWTGGSSVDEG